MGDIHNNLNTSLTKIGQYVKSNFVHKSGDAMTGNLTFPNNRGIVQNQSATSNYTAPIKWLSGSVSRAAYDPQIGHHNTGSTDGAITLLPYPTDTSPRGATVGLYIAKNLVKIDGVELFKSSGGTITGKVYINNTEDVDKNQSGALVIGNKTGENIGIDGNEIMARNNSAVSTLYLNNEGGTVQLGGPLKVNSTATITAPTNAYSPLVLNATQGTETSIAFQHGGTGYFIAGVGTGGTGVGTFGLWSSVDGYNAATITRHGTIWSGQKNTTIERQHGVLSGAGGIYMFSQAATTGSRGLYGYNNAGAYAGVVMVNQSNGNSFPATSDRRYKIDKGEFSSEDAFALLSQIQPINFSYIGDSNNVTNTGFYAQDVRDALIQNGIGYRSFLTIDEKKTVNIGEDGDLILDESSTPETYFDLYTDEEKVIYGLDYSKFTPVLWKGWQIHQNEIDSLKQKIQAQQEYVNTLEKRIEKLEGDIN